MRDVAALAKVSMKTVSRVVNGESGVSPALASRVQAASERLSYRHNLTASKLRRSDGSSATIGVVLEDVANPFLSALHRSIEDVAVKRGVLVLAGSSDEDEERERKLVSAFASRRVDGLIIQPSSHDHSYLLAERRAGTAIVFVDRPPAFLDADTVLTDNAAGCGVAFGTWSGTVTAGSLISGTCTRLRLHRRVALIGFDDILLADLLEPGITVIAQDPAAIGRAAAQVLFRRLDGDRSPSEHQIVLTRLIARGSGEIAP